MGDKAYENSRLRSLLEERGQVIRRAWDIKGEFFTFVRDLNKFIG